MVLVGFKGGGGGGGGREDLGEIIAESIYEDDDYLEGRGRGWVELLVEIVVVVDGRELRGGLEVAKREEGEG